MTRSGATGAYARRNGIRITSIVFAVATLACAGRIAPLTGAAPPPGTRLPALEVPPGARRIVFRWDLQDGSIVARGDGIARIAPPDTARVDLFLAGGFARAAAVVIGDSLRVPPGSTGAELVPAPPLLWAALGRLAVPALPDTVIRVAGDTVRATIGRPVAWRIDAVGGTLRRVERVAHDRVIESVVRTPGRAVRYSHSRGRTLVLDIESDTTSPPFDATIWRF